MKIALKLAYRNLIGAGLRTWLNVIVLSFSFVVIIWVKGLMVGWDHQAKTDMKMWQIGQGQYWHNSYEPYDPFALNESHAPIPAGFQPYIDSGEMVPILYAQGSIYPEGRMKTIKINGIPVNQKLLKIPSAKLDTVIEAIPAVIGGAMAHSCKLEKGSRLIMRWRDSKGTFDAAEIEIVDIFSTIVAQIDEAQVWIPLDVMQQKMLMPNEASVFSFGEIGEKEELVGDFKLKSFAELTVEIDEMIKMKSTGQSVFYIILLLLAMLAIFDTQVLTIFRRQKEIGTYIALGYTRYEVVGLFTIEGAMNAVFAALVAAIYGVPFFIWQTKSGFTLPMETSGIGLTISQTMYPVYSMGLILSTVLIVFLTTIVVSYWPSRRIAKMNPTEALRGKIQ